MSDIIGQCKHGMNMTVCDECDPCKIEVESQNKQRDKPKKALWLMSRGNQVGKTAEKLKDLVVAMGLEGLIEVTTPDLVNLEQRLQEAEGLIQECEGTVDYILGEQFDIMDHNKSHTCCCANLHFIKTKLKRYREKSK